MPKLKTHKGARKRFKITCAGKVKRSKAYHSHLLTKKDSGRKRNLRKATSVDKTNVSAVKRLLPYS
jgi:large subunit ribosomal protein L35